LDPLSTEKGVIHLREALAESGFLLVENYTLTAPTWVRLGREFLEHFSFGIFSFITFVPIWTGVEKEALAIVTACYRVKF
jgi:hypothetical protein